MTIVYSGNLVVIAVLMSLLVSSAFATQREEKRCPEEYRFGLYYGSWDNKGSDFAFVISSDGKPIPQKENDPEAPTQPGLYVREKRYEFAWSKFSVKDFSFATKSVDSTVFEFHGRFGCEQVDAIPAVP